jgi:diphosphomevalonate decarboxylase
MEDTLRVHKPMKATALAHPNIALIKYWGNRDHTLRIPANGSISITLGGLETVTTVALDESLGEDEFVLDGVQANKRARQRVGEHLDVLRSLTGSQIHARVESVNDFPAGGGIASSASAFAALTLAGASAYDLELDRPSLSRLARRGSGSASRSMFGGYVQLHTGEEDADAFSEQIAPPDHWPLVDLIAVVSQKHKRVGSTMGHRLAESSPLQPARVADASRRVAVCREAIQEKDFKALAEIVEQDSNMMHAVMQTSSPPLLYWRPETVALMLAVQKWREQGLDVCYTVDAGPNVHCLCTLESSAAVEQMLAEVRGVEEILKTKPGSGARLLPSLESAG